MHRLDQMVQQNFAELQAVSKGANSVVRGIEAAARPGSASKGGFYLAGTSSFQRAAKNPLASRALEAKSIQMKQGREVARLKATGISPDELQGRIKAARRAKWAADKPMQPMR